MSFDLCQVKDPDALISVWERIGCVQAKFAIACGARPHAVRVASGLRDAPRYRSMRDRSYNSYAAEINSLLSRAGVATRLPVIGNDVPPREAFEACELEILIGNSLQICDGARKLVLILEQWIEYKNIQLEIDKLLKEWELILAEIHELSAEFQKDAKSLLKLTHYIWPRYANSSTITLSRMNADSRERLILEVREKCAKTEALSLDIYKHLIVSKQKMKKIRYLASRWTWLYSYGLGEMIDIKALHIPTSTLYNWTRVKIHLSMPLAKINQVMSSHALLIELERSAEDLADGHKLTHDRMVEDCIRIRALLHDAECR